MTTQEAFDKVVEHLLTQNEKSMGEGSCTCLYRGDNGTKCAIGCLIPDELYRYDFEARSISAIRITNPSILLLFKDIPIEFLTGLQKIHDREEVKDWRQHLIEFGSRWELEWNYD